jgi:flagellar basal body-associated protein FliL
LAETKKEGRPVGAEEIRALYGVNLPEETGRQGRGGRAGRKKRTGKAPANGGRLRGLTRVLAGIAGLLVLVILAGTLYAVIKNPGGPASEEIPINGADGVTQSPGNAVFTGIGRLRIAAGSGADSPPQMVVILSVVFPYPPEDRPFTEELAGKIPLFRQIIRDYFGALSRDDLNPLDDQKAKEELLRRFNGELRLGRIESLLFNDLMIL